ncbi:hypothetical protein WUBG_11648, partial [Wuchereria bancrofti]
MQEDRATELLHVRINRELEAARDDLIIEWRRLPDVVSLSHVNILQATNLIQEVQEASVLTNHPEVSGQVSLPSNPIGDVKSVVKAWRSRSYALSDPLSFWADIHQWRIHHYNTAIRLLQQMEGNQSSQFQQGLLPFYSAANSQLMIARAARKAGLINIAIDKLSRLKRREAQANHLPVPVLSAATVGTLQSLVSTQFSFIASSPTPMMKPSTAYPASSGATPVSRKKPGRPARTYQQQASGLPTGLRTNNVTAEISPQDRELKHEVNSPLSKAVHQRQVQNSVHASSPGVRPVTAVPPHGEPTSETFGT